MDTQDFGLWAMLAFWGSAIGGIFLGIQWSKSRNKKSPAPKAAIIASLKKRLETVEISQEEYNKKLEKL